MTLIQLFLGHKRHFVMASAVAILIATAANAQGIGALGKLFGDVESAIRDQAKKEPAQLQAVPSGNPNLPTAGQREANTVDETQGRPMTQSPATQNRPDSTLNQLMGSEQAARNNSVSSVTKAALLAEFEKDYLEKSDDAGRLPGMKQSHLKVANGLATMLPAEYRVSAACVQQRSRDGSTSGSSQAMTIASAMYDVIDQLTPSANKGGMLHDRVNSLSKAGTGCPSDFPAIEQFLSEYADFAKSMVNRKLALVNEKGAKEQDQNRQAKLAADQQANEKAKKERDAQARDADMRREKKEADEKRKIALRSGAEKPASFKDHMLMNDYGTGDQFYGFPLLKPDNKVYLFGTGALNREEDGGLFVRSPGGDYIHIKTSRSTPIYGELRMNMPIVVIGRYVGNIQYTTVIGAVKTAPVIEAIAISKAPVYY